MVLVSASPLLVASAFSPPETSISIQTSHTGSLNNGGTVITGPNPQFSLSVNSANNTTVSSTQYKFGQNGNLTAYNGSFTYQGNQSHSFTLYYRSNSTGGLENWKTLNVQLDATPPSLGIGGVNSIPQYSKVNPTNLLISSAVDVPISCSDEGAGVHTISMTIENTTQNASSGALNLTHSFFSNATNNQTASFSLRCTDNVGLETTSNMTIEEDVSPPVLSLTEIGQRSGAVLRLRGVFLRTVRTINPTQRFNTLTNPCGELFCHP